jgi:oxygen-independent coproporphyrinogen-3 oxidase
MQQSPLATHGSSNLQTNHHSHDEYLGIYIHFPWCLRKCPYCDFLSIARGTDEIPREAYTTAVQRELEQRSATLGGARVRSVFFGGGTPSLWGIFRTPA